MRNQIENTSLDMAEEMCDNIGGYHLLSINSHEEQQILYNFFNGLVMFYNTNTIHLFISLQRQVP